MASSAWKLPSLSQAAVLQTKNLVRSDPEVSVQTATGVVGLLGLVTEFGLADLERATVVAGQQVVYTVRAFQEIQPFGWNPARTVWERSTACFHSSTLCRS